MKNITIITLSKNLTEEEVQETKELIESPALIANAKQAITEEITNKIPTVNVDGIDVEFKFLQEDKKSLETELQSELLIKELELLRCERELTATRERLEELENANIGRPIRAEVSS